MKSFSILMIVLLASLNLAANEDNASFSCHLLNDGNKKYLCKFDALNNNEKPVQIFHPMFEKWFEVKIIKNLQSLNKPPLVEYTVLGQQDFDQAESDGLGGGDGAGAGGGGC